MALKNVACEDCGTTVSFTVDSEVIEFSTGDRLEVREEGTGSFLSAGNFTATGVQQNNCANCSTSVYVLTQAGYEEALAELEISDDEAEITTT